MSIFNNISFINEGEQAEEYKARKQKEKEEAEKKERDRIEGRAGYHRGDTKIKHGKMVDVGEHLDKNNGIHRELNPSKHISTSRSGSRNDHITIKEPHDYKYWDKDHRDGDIGHHDSYELRRPSKEDIKRDESSRKVAKRQDYSQYNSREDKDLARQNIRDTVNRNMRRHPENWKGSKWIGQESGIFESVQFINE